MRSSVLLPQPDGPTSTVNEPSAISIETPWSTCASPKRFFTDRMLTWAIGRGSLGLRRREGKLYDDLITMSIAISPGRPQAVRAPVQRLASERLSDRLAALIAAQIEGGTLATGDRLPTEQQLATAHGVSRTVVREAVHQLKSQGLVRSRQGSGVFVTEPPAHRALAFDPKLLESMDAVVQMVELRRVIEGEIAALAAARATRAQMTLCRRALAAIDAATERGELGVEEDLGFHSAIGEATGNPQFVRLLGVLEAYVRDAMTVIKGHESKRADFMAQVGREHRAILAAIVARNPKAARAAAIEHHLNGERRLITSGVIKPSRVKRLTRTSNSLRAKPA
jgi:GntR family transcriptional repressor for pyruvate dehydrogenase complex